MPFAKPPFPERAHQTGANPHVSWRYGDQGGCPQANAGVHRGAAQRGVAGARLTPATTQCPEYGTILTEMVPAGPKVEAAAERVRTRLPNQVDERGNPKTTSRVNQLPTDTWMWSTSMS